MKRFKYDVIKLIEAVKARPCLWNKTCEAYKDRVERKVAWDEIYNLLEERYATMSAEKKRLTRETILTKWTNIRDSFIRTLRFRAAGRCRRQYILSNHLKFLLERGDLPKLPGQVGDFDEDENSLTKEDEQNDAGYNYFESHSDNEDEPSEVEPPKKKSKRDSNEDPILDFIGVDPVSVNDPRIMNEDEAFFASLLPTVVKYNEDERLDFRIEVLSLMRKIKNRRKWTTEVIGEEEVE